jgi:hypothetical protein
MPKRPSTVNQWLAFFCSLGCLGCIVEGVAALRTESSCIAIRRVTSDEGCASSTRWPPTVASFPSST